MDADSLPRPGRLRMKKAPAASSSSSSSHRRARANHSNTHSYTFVPRGPHAFSAARGHDLSLPASFEVNQREREEEMVEGEAEEGMLEEMFYEESERRRFVEGLLEVELGGRGGKGERERRRRMEERWRVREEEARRRRVLEEEREERERKERGAREERKRKREEERRREEMEEMFDDLKKERASYAASWASLLVPSTSTSPKPLLPEDVPWPITFSLPPTLSSLTRVNMSHFLFHGLEKEERKRVLREARRTYHPDRFARIVARIGAPSLSSTHASHSVVVMEEHQRKEEGDGRQEDEDVDEEMDGAEGKEDGERRRIEEERIEEERKMVREMGEKVIRVLNEIKE
ncbi:hypothetical protein BT69DRAFT_1342612 [Atractiella rhizophila]|nr:hypothetical protein BT69DRAFT_1342612 [Atractiella rhizophila]